MKTLTLESLKGIIEVFKANGLDVIIIPESQFEFYAIIQNVIMTYVTVSSEVGLNVLETENGYNVSIFDFTFIFESA